MSWVEVEQASKEQRYELVLTGNTISERITANGLDSGIFQLTKLNFLQISNTCLQELPLEIGNLVHLKTLDLHRNAIQNIPKSIGALKDLKTLDLSGNVLQELPNEIGELQSLHSLNLNCNQILIIPSLENAKHIARLDISHNNLSSLPEGVFKLEFLADFNASSNKIDHLSEEVSNLQVLKNLDLSENKLEAIPGSLSMCVKLKELNFKGNCIKDNRLGKLINQCSTKAVLDYVGHAKEKGKGKKGGKKGRAKKMSEGEPETAEGPVVKVLHSDRVKVFVQPAVLEVRPYLVCVLVKNLDLTDPAVFKKFISIQTKLHESICDQRTLATIATHNLALLECPLFYDAALPSDIHLLPLGRQKAMNANELVTALKKEALKQKQNSKRSSMKSGLFKFLSLVEEASQYAYIRDTSGKVISLPPITNSESSKIKANKMDVLIEVTSSKDLPICKEVMDALIQNMLEAGMTSTEQDAAGADMADSTSQLVLEQVRVTTDEGQLKVVYPSHVDLVTESFKVIHLT